MTFMVHLLVQNTRNQNIRITNRIKNGMSLKFNAHHARNSIVVPPHIWHSRPVSRKMPQVRRYNGLPELHQISRAYNHKYRRSLLPPAR